MSGNFSLLDFNPPPQTTERFGKLNLIVVRLSKQIDNYIDISGQFLHPVTSPVSQTRKQRFLFKSVIKMQWGKRFKTFSF